MKCEKGQALPLAMAALALGALVVPVFMKSVSVNSTTSRIYSSSMRQLYSCDAGVEDAIWYLQQRESEVPQFTINGNAVNVTIEDEGGQIYKVTSIATSDDGSSSTAESYVQSTSGGPSLFDYAAVSLDGDIRMDEGADIYSDPAGDGDVYANGGNVDLNDSSSIDGDATATGTIDVASGASIGGTQTPGADTLAGLATQMALLDAKILLWKADAQNHDVECVDIECGDITCGSYTWNDNSTWEPSPGTYGRVYTKRHMTISGSGTWIFTDTVCTGRDLTISGSADVTFQGTVKTGHDLIISTSGTVIFQDTVCVGPDGTRYLDISGSGTVMFQGAVKTTSYLNIEDSADATFESRVRTGRNLELSTGGTVTFQDTVCVGPGTTTRDLEISGNGDITFNGSVSVADILQITQSVDVTFAGTVLVDDDVRISGTGTVTFEGPVKVTDNLEITGNGGMVNFEDSVYGDDLVIENSKVVQLVGPAGYDIDRIGVYVTNQITMENTAQLQGRQNVVAEDRIRLYNSSKINPAVVDAADIPFLVSTGDYIRLYGSSEVTALAYAPTDVSSAIMLDSNSKLYGCAIGDNIRLQGWNSELEYPTGLSDRQDLQDLVGAGGEGGVEILSWK